jgi:hypothetical protein
MIHETPTKLKKVVLPSVSFIALTSDIWFDNAKEDYIVLLLV